MNAALVLSNFISLEKVPKGKRTKSGTKASETTDKKGESVFREGADLPRTETSRIFIICKDVITLSFTYFVYIFFNGYNAI